MSSTALRPLLLKVWVLSNTPGFTKLAHEYLDLRQTWMVANCRLMRDNNGGWLSGRSVVLWFVAAPSARAYRPLGCASQENSMKAAFLTAPREMEIRELPEPKLSNPGEVLLHIDRVGVCGSDV